MANKKTSKALASTAGKVMSNPNSSKTQRSLAASALSQTGNNKTTSESMETKASKVMQSNKYSKETKGLAASVLSQATKKPGER
ncbi:hypothetical protein [Sulfurimonas diazotrophicus]|uniref:SMP domain-containing protein n=1 Tax=Sulfurimonas diazotrophicus TaxID=3131939 RepID=A0ABZ3HA40_9BACT